MLEIKKKNYKTTSLHEKNGVVWIEFDALKDYPVKHAYSTRIGGVSTGVCESMNLRNCEWDTEDNYEKNMRLFCNALEVPFNRIVASHQTHTTNIKVVKEDDVPTGTLFGRQFQDIDGLITNIPETVLVTSFADCIPLYIYDPLKNVIAMCHAGWRGTVGKIGQKAVNIMNSEFGCMSEDMIACIGPGICKDCYEVSRDVYDEFNKSFHVCEMSGIFTGKKDGKYQLDLWLANRITLEACEILPQNIHVTDICTKCNPKLLFSHRVMGNARGNQCGFFMLEKR